MINILSIRSSLAFAPYIVESFGEFLTAGVVTSRVVRQGGSGLILRSDGEIVVRHNNRQEEIGVEDARHYFATVGLRHRFYEVNRLEDEVVMANVGRELLLSHPQSDLWLNRGAVVGLLQAFGTRSVSNEPARLPEWLSTSSAAGRLLLSDQRSGRWVLLGDDHIRDLERRLPLLERARGASSQPQPPTISVKGIAVHLQSALMLAETLESFAATGHVQPFTDHAPNFRLTVTEATGAIEIADADLRLSLTAREARKWGEILRSELARLNSVTINRGRIRTVFADGETGRWVLQWGDEVLAPCDLTERTPLAEGEAESLHIKTESGLLIILSPDTGACVALQENELSQLSPSR